MESDNPEFTLPPAPRGLCFDRNDFVKSNFSVDNFLSEHQNAVSLETMRDDLGIYLKVLRLAMIELINKDYANFVNLSATLIGFDKAIEKIQVPLGQLNEEVLSVKECLEEAMKEVAMWLNQRNTLRQKKLLLKYYSQTLTSLNTLNDILKSFDDKKAQEQIVLADRAAMQYNQLKFAISKCSTLVKSELQVKFDKTGDKLYGILDDLLLKYWKNSDENNLLKVLITLASLDRASETERLIRKQAISPLIQDIINEQSLQKNKKGLKGIYEKLILLLSNELKLLLSVMQHSKLQFTAKKYTFIVNCFWCEVESRIEVNLASIFAPGNPKIFYQRYSESMDFVKKLEQYCTSKETIKLLHNTSEYKSFQKRWNLPVYFQIRFQEIAGNFEATLHKSSVVEGNSEFFLNETYCCWKSLQDCWSDGIYIEALAHKFWKLSLQLISRYVTWAKEFCKKKLAQRADTSVNKDYINNSINLYLDVEKLIEKLPHFLEMVERRISIKNDVLSKTLKFSEDSLRDIQVNIKKFIVNELSDNYTPQLKQVSDIPRLYRKTNRSIPTRPCNYIDVITKSIQELIKDTSGKLNNTFLNEILEGLFNMLTNTYCKSVEDVLTSVQKTEDSLRRLKQIRDRTTYQTTDISGITDSDKIRLQLKVDVVAYNKLAESMQLNINNIDKIRDLNAMVTDAVKNIDIK